MSNGSERGHSIGCNVSVPHAELIALAVVYGPIGGDIAMICFVRLAEYPFGALTSLVGFGGYSVPRYSNVRQDRQGWIHSSRRDNTGVFVGWEGRRFFCFIFVSLPLVPCTHCLFANGIKYRCSRAVPRERRFAFEVLSSPRVRCLGGRLRGVQVYFFSFVGRGGAM